MGANIFRQEDQIRKSDTYTDTTVPSAANYETNPSNLEDDLNSLRSRAKRNLVGVGTGHWYDDLVTPSALEAGTQRGINQLNDALHLVEKQRRLRRVKLLVDISVPASSNHVVLGSGELPTQTTAAVGSVTTLGTVAAAATSFGSDNQLDLVSGLNALAPKNLVEITDNVGDPILSSGRKVWALFHTESSTDGHTITTSTPTRAQLSFVRPNSAFSALESCPAADIGGKTIRYHYTERVRHEDLNEQDYLSGAAIDIGAGAVSVTRQIAYDNQSGAVTLTASASLDLGSGLYWEIRDTSDQILFRMTEGASGGNTSLQIGSDVDTFNVDAIVNDFDNGISVDTGSMSTAINVGVTANQIDSGGALKVASGGGSDLELEAAGELTLTDSYRAGSSWSIAAGISLADSSQEWSDFETQFGEVSLLNAIEQASKAGGIVKVHATKTSAGTVAPDTNISGPSNDNNIDTDLGDLSAGDFVQDYDFFHNGQYLRPDPSTTGANNHDVYPGTSLANGQIKLKRRLKQNDEIAVFKRA